MIAPRTLLLLATASVTALALLGCKATRAGYESAPYRVLQKDGRFEIREYPPLTLVQSPPAEPESAASQNFRRLFAFITGSNAEKRKIPMTTPVFLSSQPAGRSMAFVMPSSLPAHQVPRPTDPSLQVRSTPSKRFAVLRYSGRQAPQTEQARLAELRAWIQEARLRSLADPTFAYFDPPWTPPFLRRIEVMLPLHSPEKP
ncbi:MAG: hypothetical protein RLZZ142_2290 [Verrucomicrobiota bacterium]